MTRAGPIRIERVDLVTGRRALVHDLRPADVTGFWRPASEAAATVTPDGRSYAYHHFQFLPDLYVAEGLH